MDGFSVKPKAKRPNVNQNSSGASLSYSNPSSQTIANNTGPSNTPKKSIKQKFKTPQRITINLKIPKFIRKFVDVYMGLPFLVRVFSIVMALVFVVIIFAEVFIARDQSEIYTYGRSEVLLPEEINQYSNYLQPSPEAREYVYNKDYTPAVEVAGNSSSPQFTATFPYDSSEGVSVTDVVNNVSVTFKPKFPLEAPLKDGNRLLYPLKNNPAMKVYTMGGSSIKEDILLDSYVRDSMIFDYELKLPDYTQARLEKDGSIGIYGPENELLLGNIAAGSESDATLLKKARENSAKNTLLFRIPAPFILEADGYISEAATVKYALKDNNLSIIAENLSKAKYPLSIDPSVYIETAAKLMRGNNETNTDFDVDNELIQKSQTTGARIDSWQGNLDMSTGVWGHSSVSSGGYVYRSGGRTGVSTTKPQVASATESFQNSNSTTFTMNMPATRPAGDLYIAVMCYDGDQGDGSGGSNAGNTISTPSGWTKYANRNGHAAYYKIGTDQGGGNESASYAFTGDSENWAGSIIRVTGFNASDPINTSSVGHSNSNAQPVFPAVTPDEDSTLIIRAAGADNDEVTSTAWVPSGHTSIEYGGSTQNNNDCAYVAASLDSSPASGVSTGTATTTQASFSDVYGASTIAINPIVSGSPATSATVDWAKFNSSSLAIESPNPGDGVCAGWCNDSVYNLPDERRGHSMVAYNGYLYVMGGVDDSGARASTVYIAKLGANGEPQLWHPTDTNKNNWVYWFTDSGLSSATAKSYFGAVATNNRMYILGGQTNATPGGVTTVEVADILPNGKLGSWTTTGMQALPSGAGTHMQNVQIYNNTIYVIGGFEGAATSSANLRDSVYYSRLNSDGTMNAWQATEDFPTARASFGGTFSYIWGAYIYMGGGCSAVNASGYCTTISGDMYLSSINADGSIDVWRSLGSLDNSRIGYSLIGWQNGLYRIGGCTSQNTTSGECTTTLADVDYGVINPAGEVSTVNITEASGTAPCSGGSPQNCDLPPLGDNAGQGGQMLNASTILNGYMYVIGGCTNLTCSQSSGNISYVAIASDGSMQAPSTCGGTSYGAWCVDNTNRVNGTSGASAAGIATFNNRIYIIGGIDDSANGTAAIYYNTTNSDGSLAGAWTSVSFAAAGITGYSELAYTYAFTRANPSSTTNPGNLYILGGCGDISASAGCAGSDYRTEVYKCNIAAAGGVSGCTTTGQMQIDSTPVAAYPGDTDDDGLGIHSGTVYANYIFLIGGYSQNEGDKDDTIYAKIDNNNNIVNAETGLSTDDWIESPNKLSTGRRRGWAFGYNGHIYAVGGYEATGDTVIPFIEWSKMNVSNGSIDAYVTSSVQINQRWGLSMTVSNSYAYVIGGCDDGSSPGGCNSFEPSVQTFQLYNNNSGSVADFTAQSDQTFTADTDRLGASAVILNGYLYVAGGCTSATDCTNATNSVQYASLSAADGSVGTWAAGGNLPADRTWGALAAAGGTLYYVGGQDDAGTGQTTVYYTSSISSGNPTWSGTAASNGLPSARTRAGTTVWDNRIYVVGGAGSGGTCTGGVCDTVFVSPKLSSGGNISSAWSTTTAFNVDRQGLALTAYANNLYLIGGSDGTNYFSDVQFTPIGYKTGTISQSGTTVTGSGTTFNSGMVGSTIQYTADGSTATVTGYTSATSITVDVSKTVSAGSSYTIQDGSVGTWSYSRSLPGPISDGRAVSANGYIYLVGGRSAASTCLPKVQVAPISANTTIASGNNPTGVGEWYETNVRYTGNRYGAAVEYSNGKIYTMGGGCVAPLSSNRHYFSSVNSQPQVAIYSRMIDTDTDVFPTNWLLNGLDNSIGARWNVRYRSMNDTDGVATDCGTADMTTWGQDTNFGEATLGRIENYIPKDGSGNNISCARYFYFYISIDASRTFGYPEDVNRGPTISDLSLFYTADPSKRLRHGKTFTGGEQQPLDTPCRQSGGQSNCSLP
jgi:N-acetylneuraminic acid mutarotase